MMEFGKSLRAAREAKGYTIGQVAEMTRLLPAIVEGLENEDFSRIAAPIYGRGFVRLYCEAVGLESKPFVDEFMDIANGNRDTPIRERGAQAAAAPEDPLPETVPAEIPAPAEPPAVPSPSPEPDLFAQQAGPVPPSPATDPVIEPVSGESPDDGQSLSRYATPFRQTRRSAIPPSFWRMGVLAAAGLAVLILLLLGIRALYRTTTADTRKEQERTEQLQPAPAAAAKAPRAQQRIPHLYID